MVRLCAPTTEEQELHLRQAEQGIIAARSLTQQLIGFADGGIPSRQINDLTALIRESMEITLGDSTIKAACTIASDLRPVDVDEDQFRQVLRALILNAREASFPGSTVHLDARNITLTEHAAPGPVSSDYLRIQISDQGSGMSADVLPKIFDPYFSTKQRGTQKGMGLGLALSRTIIQKHRGKIYVDSEPNRGTIVTIHLPVARTTMPRPLATPRVSTKTKARLLVMDDEEMLRDTIAMTLRQLGYNVDTAADGSEAVTRYDRAAAEGQPFDAVILDLSVRGGMGGSEAMKALQARDPLVRAALMTGYTNNDAFREHMLHGFKGALAKPFSIEALHTLVADLLQSPHTGFIPV
jgi:CheY-like chemotaxis protein